MWPAPTKSYKISQKSQFGVLELLSDPESPQKIYDIKWIFVMYSVQAGRQ